MQRLRETSEHLQQLLNIKKAEHAADTHYRGTQSALQTALQVLTLAFLSSNPWRSVKWLSRHYRLALFWLLLTSSHRFASRTAMPCAACHFVRAQAGEDPPEELLEAAENACEAYDGAIRNTEAMSQKYLEFCSQTSSP